MVTRRRESLPLLERILVVPSLIILTLSCDLDGLRFHVIRYGETREVKWLRVP